MPTLESKSEIKHNILKFTNQINNALTQAYGNVTIFVPQSDNVGDGDAAISMNIGLLDQYKRAVVSNILTLSSRLIMLARVGVQTAFGLRMNDIDALKFKLIILAHFSTAKKL